VLLNAIRQAIERSHAALDREAELSSLRGCYASLSGPHPRLGHLAAHG
jgi:hypothetical protein